MRQGLDTIAGLVSGDQVDAFGLDWSALRFQHTTAIRSKLAETYSPATANKLLSALRGVVKSAWKLGQMDAETYHRARSIENVKGETLPAGRHVTTGELEALIAVCAQDPTPAGVRDAAIIGVLYTCGLRRAELVKLHLSDFDADQYTLKVEGKRNKERLTFPVNGAGDALCDWVSIRGDEPGPLFCPINKGGVIQSGLMTTQAIYGILRKRAKQAGVKDLSPHDFRRTCAGDLLDAGADLSIVQKLLGHASPTTTARYDRRPEEAKRRAAERLHIPYHSPALDAGD